MKKQALLIGINQYQNLTELKYARQDAEAVANALKQNYCFSDDEIILLTDAKRGRLFPSTKGVIQWHLEDLIQQKHEFDLFIFGFWGHGLYRSGQRYLCPQAVMDEDVCELGLSFDALQKQIVNVQAKNTCMIFDCCQTIDARGEAQPLTDDDQTIMENAARNIVFNKNKLNPGVLSNVAILNSCSKGQSAYEWDERKHGIFTAHLLDAMNRRIDSVSSLISYVGNHVKQTALDLGKDQKPYYTLNGDADFPLPVSDSAAPPVPGDVFISYRHCNADLVKPVVEEFKRRSISYFVDWKDIDYGEQYGRIIKNAISKCKVLLLFWTNDVQGSEDIINEVSLAKRGKKKIVPYKLGTFNPDEHDLIYELAARSWCEYPQQTPESITQIVDKIERMLTGRAPALLADKTSPKPELSTHKPSGNGNKISTFIADRLNQLENDALEAIDKEDYQTAIPKLEEILALDSSFTAAQKLLAFCKTIIEERKRREAEAERRRREAEQKAEVELRQREAEEARRRYLEAEEVVRRRLEAAQKLEAQQRAEAERRQREAEEARRRYLEAEEVVRRRLEAAQKLEAQQRAEAELRQREAEAKKHDLSIPGDKAGERKTVTVNGVEFAFRWCPPGTFMMGSPTSEKGRYDNEKQHRVTLTKGFWMMETQVTQKQWKAVMGDNPSYYNGDDLPVEEVSWYDCQEFCKKTGLQLPTEAQWEYACRAGTTGAYAGNLDDMAWYGYYSTPKGTSKEATTHPVGTKKPNAWGLYDMHGNVWEWCADRYDDYPSGSVTDPTGPSNGSSGVYRGGSWLDDARYCRSAYRYYFVPEPRGGRLGVRFSRSITSPEN